MKTKWNTLIIALSVILSASIYIVLNLPSDPDDKELNLYFRAAAAYENTDLELCRELTGALAKGNPHFHQALLLKSKAEFFSADYKESVRTLTGLLKRKKDCYEAEIWLVRCYIQMDEIENAKLLCEDLHSRSPEDPRILSMLASIAYFDGDYQSAIEYYSRAVLFEEELALIRIELAKIYSSLMNPEEADVHLSKALNLLSDDSPLRSAVIILLKNQETDK